jgi:hypothetical protein
MNIKARMWMWWTFQQHLDLGENTLQGGHFGHFHDMYIKYISTKCVAFIFGFHFWCLGLIFLFSQSWSHLILFEKIMGIYMVYII